MERNVKEMKAIAAGVYGTIYKQADGVIIKEAKLKKGDVTYEGNTLCKMVRELAIQNYVSNFSTDHNITAKALGFDFASRKIFMEDGGFTFSNYRWQLSRSDALVLLYNAAKKMAYYYSLGLIHGDLSTSNILYSPYDKQVRLIDFGSSTVEMNNGMFILQVIIFCSPELLRRKVLNLRSESLGLIELQATSEIWSYGMIAYLMLSKSTLPEDKDGSVTLANYQRLFGYWDQLSGIPLPHPTFGAMESSTNLSSDDIEFLRFICKYDPKMRPNWKDIISHKIFDVVRGEDKPVQSFETGKIDMSIEKPYYSIIMGIKVQNRHPRVTKLLMHKRLTLTELSVCKSIINSCPYDVEPSISAVCSMMKCIVGESMKDKDILPDLVNINNMLTRGISLMNVCTLFPMRETPANAALNIPLLRACAVAIYLCCDYDCYKSIVTETYILYKDLNTLGTASITVRLWNRVRGVLLV